MALVNLKKITLFALLLVSCSFKQGLVVNNAEDAYKYFVSSEYLNEVWKGQCVFDLNDSSRLMKLVTLEKKDGKAMMSCIDGPMLEPFNETDLLPIWSFCNEEKSNYNGFADYVWNAAHTPGTLFIHLGEAIPEGQGSVIYVLIQHCHDWDNVNCTKPEMWDSCNITESGPIRSAAYSVLDAETGKIYW
ncbi:hypothetical protein D6745_04415 [Candidatus Woesearchaeota archaeon]|nr:MAG: hypothetical protein D6745_04415 [Candidatus Woesearchaeota archaeon]